jgi:hypothetical protein
VLSKLSLDAGASSPIDQYTLTLTSTGNQCARGVTVVPAAHERQPQTIGRLALVPKSTAQMAWGVPEGLSEQHGPVGREVVEAIRLSLSATH